jgi:tRNA(Arg) A34 adenosine deaminase TadA
MNAKTPSPAVPPPAPRSEPSAEQVAAMLDRAHALARRAMDAGHHPFGALLVAADHETVLMEQGNVDSVNHAEAVLARAAAKRWPPAELWPCTLVSTVEPCAMCAGTQYWANIGRTVFGIEEHALLAETGNHPENPTLDLPCRHVFARGQKDIRVIGPVAAMVEPITALHRRYWRSR